MFCFIYNDYFQLYQPGQLSGMLQGKMATFSVTQGSLLVAALVLAIPTVMICLSLVLKPGLLRWLTVTVGVVYTAIDILTMLASWWYYIFFNSIETVLTLAIIWCAWTWPRTTT